LLEIGCGCAAGECADALHQGSTLGGGDYPARVHQVEEVRALEAVVVGRQDRVALQCRYRTADGFFAFLPAVEEFLGFLLVQLEFGAQGFGVATVKTVLGELLLFGQADVAVGFVGSPANLVDALDVLKEGADAL